MIKPTKVTLRSQFKPRQAIPQEEWDASINNIPDKPKQQIHFLSIKPSDQNGYEQALQAITGKIITITTTPYHLIVVTQ